MEHTMRTVKELKADAIDAAEWRGHELEDWKQTPYGFTSECKHCDAYVQVIVKPMPNEIDLGGTVLALNCPHYEDGLDSKQHRK